MPRRSTHNTTRARWGAITQSADARLPSKHGLQCAAAQPHGPPALVDSHTDRHRIHRIHAYSAATLSQIRTRHHTHTWARAHTSTRKRKRTRTRTRTRTPRHTTRRTTSTRYGRGRRMYTQTLGSTPVAHLPHDTQAHFVVIRRPLRTGHAYACIHRTGLSPAQLATHRLGCCADTRAHALAGTARSPLQH